MIKKIVVLIFVFLISGLGNNIFGQQTQVEDYRNEVIEANNAVLANNPDLANSRNTTINSFEFISLVAQQLISSGFNATHRVLNGNGNPTTGDLVALWREEDTLMERYDILADAGAGNLTMTEAATAQYTGDISLDCIIGGSGGPGCDGSGGEVLPDFPPLENPAIGNFINGIFGWSLSLVGLAIFANFLYAGFLWFSAAGRPGPIISAKEKMVNSLIGAIILLAAYLILNTINPDLVKQTFILPGL